jgi:chromate transporter
MQVSPPRSLGELFLGFLSIGARSFGGVMPWAHRVMVEERRWMTEADFAETIGLCQFLPGPNIGNASIVVGKRWFGVRGSLVAFLGLFALPFVWVLALFALYADFAATNPMLRAVVTGVGAAGAGLFIGTAIKLGRVLVRKPAALALIAACFLAAGIFRVSLFLVLPLAIGIAYLCARKGWL